jgi:hypothetical protein
MHFNIFFGGERNFFHKTGLFLLIENSRGYFGLRPPGKAV